MLKSEVTFKEIIDRKYKIKTKNIVWVYTKKKCCYKNSQDFFHCKLWNENLYLVSLIYI